MAKSKQIDKKEKPKDISGWLVVYLITLLG